MTKLTIDTEEGLKDFDACTGYAFFLFNAISSHHGEDKTRKMFEVLGPLRGHDFKLLKMYELAAEYRKMPEPNIRRLAYELAKKNKTLPRSERHGPRGTFDGETMRRHLVRMLKTREFHAALLGFDLAQQFVEEGLNPDRVVGQ